MAQELSEARLLQLAEQARAIIVDRASKARRRVLARGDVAGDRIVLAQTRGDVGALAARMAKDFVGRTLKPRDTPRAGEALSELLLASTLESGVNRKTRAEIFRIALMGYRGNVQTDGPNRGAYARLEPIRDTPHPNQSNRLHSAQSEPFIDVVTKGSGWRRVSSVTVSSWTPPEVTPTATEGLRAAPLGYSTAEH